MLDVNESVSVWTGQIYARNGIAETASPLVEEQAEELADCEGLVVRVRGDGQVYSIVLTTGDLQTCSRLCSTSKTFLASSAAQGHRLCLSALVLCFLT